MNCFNETFESEVVVELENLCHGDYQCTYNIPTVPLDPICDGLKREARIEFSCGESAMLRTEIMMLLTATLVCHKDTEPKAFHLGLVFMVYLE